MTCRSTTAILAGALGLVTTANPVPASAGQATRPTDAAPPATQPATQPETMADEANPAAPGFDRAGSDAKAIEIADAVMKRMGGREAWDRTRYVSWRFFGRRLHVWDRQTDTIRVETDGEDGRGVVIMSLRTGEGSAWRDGRPVAEPDELSAVLERARAAWVNDAYWMFMPYKLKDSGVTLKYVGEQAMADGRPADVLALTFTDIGLTPGNRYHVYVAKGSGLVEQWDFYRSRDDEQPAMSTPWRNWARHGRILLSADRGPGRLHTDVGVYAELPASVFAGPAPIDFTRLVPARPSFTDRDR